MKEVYEDMMTMTPKFSTFGDNLLWCYATWQTLYTLVNTGETQLGKKFYMFRTIFFNKFKTRKQRISDLYNQNKIKLKAGDYCFYCGAEIPKENLTADHVFPRIKGGTNDMDNIIFVCKSCNSSKGKKDLLEWFLLNREQFPSPFILGHYLRQIYFYAIEHGLMEQKYEDVCLLDLPFNPRSIMLLGNQIARNHYFKEAIEYGGKDSEIR
ncbi:MAG: HNH endonuclease [Bacteroidaceae bacterium]|nr:HNH endonuclease [Bacteroidaceae bacterium]